MVFINECMQSYLLSAALMFMESIMAFTVSVICLALIVWCSNFVFTADCEIHSCGVQVTTHYCDPLQTSQE